MRFFNVNKNSWVDLKDKEYFKTPEGIVVDEKDRDLLFTQQTYDDFINYIKLNKDDTKKLFETFLTSSAQFAKKFRTRKYGLPIGKSYKIMLHEIDERRLDNTAVN